MRSPAKIRTVMTGARKVKKSSIKNGLHNYYVMKPMSVNLFVEKVFEFFPLEVYVK